LGIIYAIQITLTSRGKILRKREKKWPENVISVIKGRSSVTASVIPIKLPGKNGVPTSCGLKPKQKKG
jgi:hypothetical protein